jgi:hypothetical protein
MEEKYQQRSIQNCGRYLVKSMSVLPQAGSRPASAHVCTVTHMHRVEPAGIVCVL